MSDELVQCEECGDVVPESEATFEDVPGATLAFCDSCTEPPLHKQYGVRP